MARSLDQRDREILRALFDHELLLRYQIKVLFFSSLRRCQEVMRELREIGLVDRDLPTERIGVGKAQGHWTITEAGVQVVAVTMKKPRSHIDWMPRDTWHDSDRHREHLLGIASSYRWSKPRFASPTMASRSGLPRKSSSQRTTGSATTGTGGITTPLGPATSTLSTTVEPNGTTSSSPSSAAIC